MAWEGEGGPGRFYVTVLHFSNGSGKRKKVLQKFARITKY
jgi:hypothetical protein